MNDEIVTISKFLSLVLRHKPELIGINMSKDGWVDVKELIDKSNKSSKYKSKYYLTKNILDEVVANNDKKRFSYSPD